MKVMIIGSGGREHAMAWKTAQNPLVEKIYCVPGNGGTYYENKCENVNITGNKNMLEFALKNNVELTIVGPEAPLMDGIVDDFRKEGLLILGPEKRAAMLEGSKAYAKDFMKKYNVKTAGYEVFNDSNSAIQYLKGCEYPVVIKADGLAAGKGVVICKNFEEAEKTIEEFMIQDIFKGSGKRIIIEEFIEGVEASILSICDGETIIPFISAKDHKQIYDGGQGPNTGGMGAIAPNPYCTPGVLEDFRNNILNPTLKGIKDEGLDFRGIIFFGIMISSKGTYLLEYNVRMGDPETQAVLPLMDSDLVELIMAALNKELLGFNIAWKDRYSCCVVAASGGYPGKYNTGYVIEGIRDSECKIFYAGAEHKENSLVTSGGRVLCVTAVENSMARASENSYKGISKISFKDIYYRKDIGR